MKIEERKTFGKPSLILIMENESESKWIDEILGSEVPFKVEGQCNLSDGYGEHYVQIWNPNLHGAFDKTKLAKERYVKKRVKWLRLKRPLI